ncbi:homeobox protein 5 [Condylostylus longicornis]|uniref:homeobox protein 5 n=1 Tax=Condylostylus longicornis TaxID=2530218 RepID=UPI00244DB27E|nr:homeobox protein 5 [Condylostylus longicornis]XP_055381024.1 homeobox protein 5 [Condylostylus longicornis]
MAVFLLNICKFDGCGITFPTLMDLIEHIESTHIDYDPKVVEQKEQAQPTCLPLSYVLRFIDATRKESPFISSGAHSVDLKRKLAIKHHSYSMSSSNRSNTPTGSELDEDEMMVSESEDSNDSWTTEEFSSEFIMRYGSRHSGSSSGTPGNEKPFACPVPGCKKRYKNVNGIKYHSKNGHKKDGKVRKGYKCHCGKSYKTAQGLKSHALSSHNSSPDIINGNNINNNNNVNNNININSTNNLNSNNNIVNNSQNGRSSPSQSIGSSSPSSVSNLSGSSSLSSNIGGTLSLSTVNQSQQTSIITQHSIQPIASSATTISVAPTGLVPSNTTINQNSATVNSTNIASNILKGNLGLISIKTTSGKPATTANLIAANKILKLTATIASTSANNSIAQNEKLKFELTSTGNSISTNTNTNNNNNHNQGNTFENLPLTPISPNMQQQSQQITKTLTAAGNTITGATILGTNGNGITLLTTGPTTVHGGVLNEKPNGDDT